MAKQPEGSTREGERARWVWTPALGWATAIFAMSSVHGQSLPPLPGFQLDKLVHAATYGILALLVRRGVGRAAGEASRALAVPAGWGSALAIFLTSIYGVTDEIHQIFVPGRSADWQDWLADTLGAILAVGLQRMVSRSRPS